MDQFSINSHKRMSRRHSHRHRQYQVSSSEEDTGKGRRGEGPAENTHDKAGHGGGKHRKHRKHRHRRESGDKHQKDSGLILDKDQTEGGERSVPLCNDKDNTLEASEADIRTNTITGMDRHEVKIIVSSSVKDTNVNQYTGSVQEVHHGVSDMGTPAGTLEKTEVYLKQKEVS